MKWFSFFVFLGLFSCADKTKQQKINTIAATDSSNTLMDTVTPPPPSSYETDQKKARDSFFAIKPLLVADYDKYDSLIFNFVDTSFVTHRPLVNTLQTSYKYSKDSMPLWSITNCDNKKYKIQFKYNYEDYENALFVNGKELSLNNNINASLIYYKDHLKYIQFFPEDIHVYSINKTEYLLFSGGLQHCNGSGCGVFFYMLYNPATNRGFIVEQYRNHGITIGYSQRKKAIEFLSLTDDDNNYLGILKLRAEKFYYTTKGTVKKHGTDHIFEAYINDSMYVLTNGN